MTRNGIGYLLRSVPALFATAHLACAPASAQHADQPYAKISSREIKALSPDRIEGLLAGRGVGYALSAELNGYPGPLHVLEHGDELDLTPEQREKIEALFSDMQAEAKALGKRLVDEEGILDRMFADGSITEPTLMAQTGAIADIDGELRATHLKYHLSTADLLTMHQRHAYDRLRGYGAPLPGNGHTGHRDHH